MGIIRPSQRSTEHLIMTAAAKPQPDFETITVTTAKVACDGNAATGAGHPRVYLDLTAKGSIICPYCSRTYVVAEGTKLGHH
jgi:uncharacterized Zn-finger protein